MLTRKQAFRRYSNRIERGDERDFLYREGLGEGVPTRSSSEPTFGVHQLATGTFGKMWATTGNLLGAGSTSSCNKRKVRWQAGIRVVLIPTRNEYRDARISENLWWQDDDYSAFKSSAVSELKAAMHRHSYDSKEAMKILYQPQMSEFQNEDGDISDDNNNQALNIPRSPGIFDEDSECKLRLIAARSDAEITSYEKFKVSAKYNVSVPLKYEAHFSKPVPVPTKGMVKGGSISVVAQSFPYEERRERSVHPLAYICG